MLVLNSKNSIVMLAGSFIVLIVIFLIFGNSSEDRYQHLRAQHLQNARYAAIVIPLLTHDRDIVGEWKGIRSSGELGYGRRFTASGKMEACYSCYIVDGRFQIIDDRTVEISHRYSGEVRRWTFGFLGDELMMIWKSDDGACRIEEYRRVPVGTHLWVN